MAMINDDMYDACNDDEVIAQSLSATANASGPTSATIFVCVARWTYKNSSLSRSITHNGGTAYDDVCDAYITEKKLKILLVENDMCLSTFCRVFSRIFFQTF